MSEPTRLSDLPNGTILRYDEAKSSHGVTLSIEQFVEWGVLVPVEPDGTLTTEDAKYMLVKIGGDDAR